MYGREPAGHRLARAITSRRKRSSRRRRRRACRCASTPRRARRPGTPARTRERRGTPAASWSGRRSPGRSPPAAIQRVLPRSVARRSASQAPTISSTAVRSGLLNRNINAATGVTASTTPAISPADGPQIRARSRTARRRPDAHQRLRQQHGEGAEPEDPARQHHHPQRHRRLVHGDDVSGDRSEPNSHAFQSCGRPPARRPRSSRWPSRLSRAPTDTARRSPTAAPLAQDVPSAVARRREVHAPPPKCAGARLQ